MKTHALTAFLLCLGCAQALAQGVSYSCPGGSWSTAQCWIVLNSIPPQFRLPNPGETAYLPKILSQVALDISASPGDLYIDAVPGSSGVFSQAANSLQATEESVGPYGVYLQTGGSNAVTNELLVEATYNLRGGSLTAPRESVTSVPIAGYYSAASFIQSQGTNTLSDTLYLGAGPPVILSVGSYNLHGGSLQATSEVVGDTGVGTFMQDGGTNQVQESLTLGELPGSNGSYLLRDQGSLTVLLDDTIGKSGEGTFEQQGGTHANKNIIWLGYDGGNGTYSLHSGSLQAHDINIGNNGSGHFLQSGGSNTIDQDLSLDARGTGAADYALSGTGMLAVKMDEHIGDQGNGTFTQSGVTEHTVGGGLVIGNEDLSGTGLTWTYDLNGGELKAGNATSGGVINHGVFTYSGGRLQANIENDGLFLVHGPAIRLIQGNFYNNATLECDKATILWIAGDYVNSGIDNTCTIVHTTLFNP